MVEIAEGLPENPMDEPVADRVARGVALLDEWGPAGWRERVDLDTLDMAWGTTCVIGQVYGWGPDGYDAYYVGTRDLGLFSGTEQARYGFESLRYAAGYAELDDEWRRVLTASTP